MNLKRSMVVMLCFMAVMTGTSCGKSESSEITSRSDVSQSESQVSVSVGYITLKDGEKSADLCDNMNGNVIVKMFSGDAVTVYSINADWAKVNYGGKDGYMKLENLSFSEPEQSSEVSVETSANETPSEVPENTAPPAVQEQSVPETEKAVDNNISINNTNQIEIVFLTDIDGFQVADPVHSYPKYSPEPTYMDGYCNAYSVYIYSQPDTNSIKRETDMLYNGDPVKILGSVNGWYYISTDNGSNGELHGYVSQSYITVGKNEVQKINYNATQGQVKDGMTAWVNYTPSKTDNIETLSGGTTFTIIGNANDYWYNISYYDGKTGWISYKMVDVW
ncbi:MAG: SH3 domain-containing protein [Ruminococcus flavefaciens]|nr:SH3 domain-containing protein [Ruminococcus flavefaciens]